MFWSTFGIVMLVIVTPIAILAVVVLIKSRKLTESARALGLRKLADQSYEGTYRAFQVTVRSVVQGGNSVVVSDNYRVAGTAVGFEVIVLLYDPANGKRLTSEQRVLIADMSAHHADDDLTARSRSIEGDKLMYSSTVGAFDGTRVSLQGALDAATGAARDCLLELTGLDVWNADPKMIAKKERSNENAPWERT